MLLTGTQPDSRVSRHSLDVLKELKLLPARDGRRWIVERFACEADWLQQQILLDALLRHLATKGREAESADQDIAVRTGNFATGRGRGFAKGIFSSFFLFIHFPLLRGGNSERST